jgi:cytochrome c-type biogenesis protein CcmE
MNPRRKKRLLITSSLIAGLAITVALLLFALQQNIDLFYTPTEIIQGKRETGVKPQLGQRLRVGGMVLPGSVKRDATSLKVSFDLIDNGGGIVTVFYNGILPDLFREGQGIVAQGKLINMKQINAFEVLAKHDEEYMPPEVADALDGMDHLKKRQ